MNILVTGATKGIGRAIAEELKSCGQVFVTGRNLAQLQSFCGAGFCRCDLSCETEILEKFIKEHQIDVLVNNAGEYVYGEIEKMTPEEVERIFKINLLSPVRLISVAIPHMKSQKWGRIVNIGSISGVMGEAFASLYSSSKSGLFGLTKALALELAQDGITVNTINPGWVDTDLGLTSISESEFSKEEIIECIPQRRFVAPEEVAKLVKYLISEEAKGITGQGINLCAGLSVGI